MRVWFHGLLLTCAVAGPSVESFAQGIDIGISGVGLASVQPINDAYVGGPYLSEGIGGIGPGFGAGLHAILPNRLVMAAEYATARFEQVQYGRLVSGGFPNESVPRTTRLRDSLLSGLVGYATAPGRRRAQFVGGISLRLDDPTIDGVPREELDVEPENRLRVGLTGGADLLQQLGSRAALVIGGRYTFIDRSESLQYLGIGSHVFRFSAGVRVRID
jgi:hypothetical protein